MNYSISTRHDGNRERATELADCLLALSSDISYTTIDFDNFSLIIAFLFFFNNIMVKIMDYETLGTKLVETIMSYPMPML